MSERKYRINSSELFNLQSMYEHLLCVRDVQDGVGQDSSHTRDRIEEIEALMDKAYCVGAKVTWPELKRIREIQEERRQIRYCICLSHGDNERDAALALEI